MFKKSVLLFAIAICVFSSNAHSQEQSKSQNPIRECYSSSRTIVGYMPRNLFEGCVQVQKGPLTKDEFMTLTLSRQRGLISKTDIFRLENHYKVTPQYYKIYLGNLRDWQLEEWRRRDPNGYFEAIYDQVEQEIPRLFQHLEITKETPHRVAIQRIVDHLIRSAEYNLKIVPDTQIRGKIGDAPAVFVDKKKKLFTGYERKGQFELDEIFKVLIEKRGVCAGFSIILSNLFDRLGIVNAPLLLRQPSAVGHAAVVVKLDDKEYIVDPVLEQSIYKKRKALAEKSKKRPEKNKLFYSIEDYKKVLKANNFKFSSIDRAEMENGYARNEQYILELKKEREQKQKRANQQ